MSPTNNHSFAKQPQYPLKKKQSTLQSQTILNSVKAYKWWLDCSYPDMDAIVGTCSHLSISVYPFSPLVPVVEMGVKDQLTPKESWVAVTAECRGGARGFANMLTWQLVGIFPLLSLPGFCNSEFSPPCASMRSTATSESFRDFS